MEHTTHISVADRQGGLVALTQSVGPTMGSKVVTPGLGFVHAATMGYLGELERGTRRHWSSQSPLLVLRDGRPVYVIGGAGARRILSGIVETLSRAIDEALPIDQAIAAPRLHPSPARIELELGAGAAAWPDIVLRDMRERGFVVATREFGSYFARINAIHRDESGMLTGVADPRWTGAAASPRY
jgi:gamma-glutamyltranspeptidase/glutathione hydrolase